MIIVDVSNEFAHSSGIESTLRLDQDKPREATSGIAASFDLSVTRQGKKRVCIRAGKGQKRWPWISS
jgi:hypothetical protein